MKQLFVNSLKESPIIASIRRAADLDSAFICNAKVVLLSSGSILNLPGRVKELKKHNKIVLVHVDLINGLGKDSDAVAFLKKIVRASGIVTPNSYLISEGRKQNLITIQRAFIYDSVSLKASIKILKQSSPDFIEVLPGMAAPVLLDLLKKHFNQHIIAAGFIRTHKQVHQLLANGIYAIDTSEKKLWNIKGDPL